MNNGLILDIALALLLLLSLIIGAKRGLFRSLMGVVVLLAALIGAAVLSNTLTGRVTDAVMPRVEQKVSDWLGVPEEMTMGSVGSGLLSSDSGENPAFSEWFEKLDLFRGSDRFMEHLGDQARSAAQTAARSLVETVVHAIVFLVSFLLLLLVLKLLTRGLDKIFDLPVLSTVNAIGGGALGLAECVLLLLLICYFAPRLGVTFFQDNAQDSYLLPYFTDHTPGSLAAALFH